MGKKKGPIETTPREDRTYNSSTIYSFSWRERPGSEEFDKGQLIVKFRNNPSNPDDYPKGTPSSAYTYNVPKEVFNEMKRRAVVSNPQNTNNMSAGEWFNNRLVNYVDWEDRKDGDLYLGKVKLNE
jgi:hypothetical protein